MIASIKSSVESYFESFGLFVFDRPLRVLAASLSLVAFLAWQIPAIRVDTSSEALLQKNDPSLQAYNNFRDQFGRSELLIVAISSADIFSVAFVRRLQAFQDEIESKVPYVREVTSLINVRDTRGEGDELVVTGFLENWREPGTDFQQLKKRAAASHLFRNYLLSADMGTTAVVIETEAAIAADDSESLLDGFENSENFGMTPEVTRRARYFSRRKP